MAALESLAPDQRAVLQLVLRQGRSYADLGSLLKISPEAVQARAHAGMTVLAGEDLPAESRGRVTDYLLGQLPDSERAATRSELAASGPTQAWARKATEGLAPIAGDALPEIPELEVGPAPEPVADTPAPEAPTPDQPATGTAPLETTETEPEPEPVSVRREGDPPPSRLGGLALIAGVAILAAAIVLALVVKRGDDSPSTTTTPVGTTQAGTSTTPGAGTTTTPAAATGSVRAQINLNDPNGRAKPVGIVQLKRVGNSAAFVVVLQGLAKPSKGFVSVWLTGAKTAPLELVGIPRGKVRSGRLSAFAPVPKDLTPYDTMLVTRQPGSPRRPSRALGRILLLGALRAVPKG
jgi:hypothetical protein